MTASKQSQHGTVPFVYCVVCIVGMLCVFYGKFHVCCMTEFVDLGNHMYVGMQSMQNCEDVFGIQLPFQVQQQLLFLVIKKLNRM